MNRFLVIAAVLGLVGCATDVIDPIEESAEDPQRDPPAQLRSGELEGPRGEIAVDQITNGGAADLGPQTPVPMPLPAQ